ncbi:MAG: hypothetical protein AB1673_08200 [Actinomycetota bacterium]|jgi:hypothetical protein
MRAAPDNGARPAADVPSWAAPPRQRRLSRGARQRLWALVALVVVGAPAFLVAGRYWVSDVDLDGALARFRAAGPEAAQPVPGLPEPGVYRYRTTGGEHISFLDYRRDYSATTMRIVTRHSCGVREDHWFLVQHLEYYVRCGDELPSYGTDIAYWWTHGTQDFVCQPGGSFDMAGYRPGDRVEWTCADEDTRADQVTEYLGDVDMVVDGETVRARHTRWVTTFSGATVGVATVEDWFHPGNGLLLRETRTIGLDVGSGFVGRMAYIDQSEITLLSLEPAR